MATETKTMEATPSTFLKALEGMRAVPDTADIEKDVREIQADQSGGSPDEQSRRVVRATTARLTGLGAVAALPGVIPALGTAAQVAIGGAVIPGEAWLILRNLTAMQLTVAGLYGLDVRHLDRRDELLIVWGLETGAVIPATEAGKRLGARIAVNQFNKRVSGQVLRRINQKLGTTVVTKFGAKRGGVALGRVIPFGVGAAVGGAVNYVTARSFGAALIRYYSTLRPANAEVVVVE